MERIICPRCEQQVFVRLHSPEAGPYVTFSCPNTYRTRHGRRGCRRPVIVTTIDGEQRAFFPPRWDSIANLSIDEIIELYA